MISDERIKELQILVERYDPACSWEMGAITELLDAPDEAKKYIKAKLEALQLDADVIRYMQAENAKLREALRCYSNENNYVLFAGLPALILTDGGKIARKALGEGE